MSNSELSNMAEPIIIENIPCRMYFLDLSAPKQNMNKLYAKKKPIAETRCMMVLSIGNKAVMIKDITVMISKASKAFLARIFENNFKVAFCAFR